jgi:Pyruvate/2-oxoacid:ferredoxin oxidoreductase delta subunit
LKRQIIKRQIIKINEIKCTGCGKCIPNCPEGALQVIDGKARLINDLFCDGLGACLGNCPEDAITTEIREAEPYDEKKVMENIVKAGKNTIVAHLKHLKNHNEFSLFAEAMDYLKENSIEIPEEFSKNKKIKKVDNESCGCNENPSQNHPDTILGGCPGARSIDLSSTFKNTSEKSKVNHSNDGSNQKSYLRNWPIQITLAPLQASYFNDADLLIAADCTNAAYPNLQNLIDWMSQIR